MKEKASNLAIIHAISATLAWTGVALYVNHLMGFTTLLLTATIYPFIHIFIARISVMIEEFLFDGIDAIFELKESERWGDWSRTYAVQIGAWWPLAAPLLIPFGILGCIFGLAFRVAFR